MSSDILDIKKSHGLACRSFLVAFGSSGAPSRTYEFMTNSNLWPRDRDPTARPPPPQAKTNPCRGILGIGRSSGARAHLGGPADWLSELGRQRTPEGVALQGAPRESRASNKSNLSFPRVTTLPHPLNEQEDEDEVIQPIF